MTGSRDDRESLPPDDEAFVEGLARNFTPAPMGGNRRASFDATLAEGLARRPATGFGAPLLAGAALAALVVWLLLPTALEEPPSVAVLAETRSAAEWEGELLDAVSFGEIEAFEGSDELPDDYAAIAAVFLDG